MHRINKRGQSTVEYVLLVAAVIAVMVAFSTSKNSGVQSQLCSTLQDATDQMTNLSGRFGGSEAGTNGVSPTSTYTFDPTATPQ